MKWMSLLVTYHFTFLPHTHTHMMWIASTFLIQLEIRDVYGGKKKKKRKKLYEHSKKLLKDGQFLLVEKKVRFVPSFSLIFIALHLHPSFP